MLLRDRFSSPANMIDAGLTIGDRVAWGCLVFSVEHLPFDESTRRDRHAATLKGLRSAGLVATVSAFALTTRKMAYAASQVVAMFP
jgi:hypothetical protein